MMETDIAEPGSNGHAQQSEPWRGMNYNTSSKRGQQARLSSPSGSGTSPSTKTKYILGFPK